MKKHSKKKKNIFQKIDDFLFSDYYFFELGFMANVGMATLAFLIGYLAHQIFFKNSNYLGLLIFSGIYWITVIASKFEYTKGTPKKFRLGYDIASIVILLLIIQTLFQELF